MIKPLMAAALVFSLLLMGCAEGPQPPVNNTSGVQPPETPVVEPTGEEAVEEAAVTEIEKELEKALENASSSDIEEYLS